MNTETVELTAEDGHRLSAWCIEPAGSPRGAIVVLQEVFGINSHIKAVTRQFRNVGYAGLAPALFDRIERGVSLGYGPEDYGKAVSLYGQMKVEASLLDVSAAVRYAKKYGRVGVVGYCFGGLLAWVAACKVPGVDAAVGYYGGGITDNLNLAPKAPTLLHFGTRDEHVPIAPVARIAALYPEVVVHTYDAGHGFNCDERQSFDRAAAELAGKRTVQFLGDHLG